MPCRFGVGRQGVTIGNGQWAGGGPCVRGGGRRECVARRSASGGGDSARHRRPADAARTRGGVPARHRGMPRPRGGAWEAGEPRRQRSPGGVPARASGRVGPPHRRAAADDPGRERPLRGHGDGVVREDAIDHAKTRAGAACARRDRRSQAGPLTGSSSPRSPGSGATASTSSTWSHARTTSGGAWSRSTAGSTPRRRRGRSSRGRSSVRAGPSGARWRRRRRRRAPVRRDAPARIVSSPSRRAWSCASRRCGRTGRATARSRPLLTDRRHRQPRRWRVARRGDPHAAARRPRRGRAPRRRALSVHGRHVWKLQVRG